MSGSGDYVEIPEADLPPGLPDWMGSPADWGAAQGTTAAAKRATITVTIPGGS